MQKSQETYRQELDRSALESSPIMLSIVIVNYNVLFFLVECLYSVMAAIRHLSVEIIVVDNCSADFPLEWLAQKFPQVTFIANEENLGFAKANNIALRQARGKYVLLLNPDTVLAESALEKSIDFMESHPKAGGLGARMIDARGRFLPESKRGFPTPFVSFCKIFGLSRLFPKSRCFGRYHLGFLDDKKIQQVDVLAGAYMMMRKTVLDEIGLLDERFFMYGEDIDLSYRIVQAGYQNYYHPEVRLLHYKGESTKKGSLRYIRVFYQAMIIFAQKHYRGHCFWLYSLVIHLAVYFRASLAAVSIFFKKCFYRLFYNAGKKLSRLQKQPILVYGDAECSDKTMAFLQKVGLQQPVEYEADMDKMDGSIIRLRPSYVVIPHSRMTNEEMLLLMERLSSHRMEFKIIHFGDGFMIGGSTMLS